MKRVLCRLSAILLAVLGTVSSGADTNENRPDLTGVVKSKNGQPLSGASAFIYTAGPKLGVGFL